MAASHYVLSRKAIALTALVSLMMLSSCGSTLITSYPYRSDARIYVNNESKGGPKAYIPRTGVPKRILVEVKQDGRVLGKRYVSRQFTIGSFLAGCATNGIGYLLVWSYPKTIVVDLDEPKNDQPRQSWNQDRQPDGVSPWDRSPSGNPGKWEKDQEDQEDQDGDG